MGRRASGTGSVLTGQGGMNRAPNLPLDEMITLSEWWYSKTYIPPQILNNVKIDIWQGDIAAGRISEEGRYRINKELLAADERRRVSFHTTTTQKGYLFHIHIPKTSVFYQFLVLCTLLSSNLTCDEGDISLIETAKNGKRKR